MVAVFVLSSFVHTSFFFETLEKNQAPFPHYTTRQENVQKHQAIATDEATYSALRTSEQILENIAILNSN
jgi:hypothetical protein